MTTSSGTGPAPMPSSNPASDPIARLLADPPDLPVVAGLTELRSLLTVGPGEQPAPSGASAVVPAPSAVPVPSGASAVVPAPSAVPAPSGASAVVTAPPGTGKTTLVPPLVADVVRLAAEPAGVSSPAGPASATARRGAPGRVIVTQPRRVAARAAARRLADLLGEPVGRTVGYAVRGERKSSTSTRIEVVTAGLLLRRLQRDPDLPGVAAVVLDEVHERSLDSDLLLTLLLDARAGLRDDLLLVAMSATLDVARLPAMLGPALGTPAPILDVPSPIHPLEESFAEPPASAPRLGPRGVPREFLAHVAAVTAQALAEHPGDALVFLPGAREIDDVVSRLRSALSDESLGPVDVLPLHGRLSSAAQDAALAPSEPERRRVVVATNVAESSLTVPGVRIVVDSTLACEPRLDVARGMSGLVTVGESRAAGIQRAGRAGREGPGAVVRCCTPSDWARAPQAPTPEVLFADLTRTALELAVWGVPGGEGLEWIDEPPAPAMAEAQAALRALALTDADGAVTPLGRAVSAIPAEVRESAALLRSVPTLGRRRAAEATALLTSDLRAPGGDLTALARQVRDGSAGGAWRAEARRLERALPDDVNSAATAGSSASVPDPGPSLADAAGLVAALARPGWIARRRGPAPSPTEDASYATVGGTGLRVLHGSALASSEWLAVADVDLAPGGGGRGEATVRAAAPIDEELALAVGDPWLVEESRAVWDGGRLRGEEVRRLGGIVLASRPAGAPSPVEAARAVVGACREQGLGILPWTPGKRGDEHDAATLRARLALLHRELGEPWPAVDDDALLARADEWLAPAVEEFAHRSKRFDLARLGMLHALRALLPWPEASRLDELAPERIEVPSGSHVRLDYLGDQGEMLERPVLAARVQECFGWAETPRIAGGRVPVLIHLLSPARRPVAVTDDLRSFWEGPYRQVRAEMRGRYPKHPWPEDPWTAPATSRTKRRS